MITSSNLINALITSCLSVFFIFQEISSICIYKNSKNLESRLEKLSKEIPFFSYTKKINSINQVFEAQEVIHTPLFEYQHLYQLGKLKLALGLETSNTEDKISSFCEARDFFISASRLSPNTVNYHIAIADIESISPYLSSTCQNYYNNNKKLKLDATNATGQISIQERLKLIKHLSPTDPTTLYQVALIEKNLGSRIEAMQDFRAFEENSLVPNSKEIISYLLSQVQSEEEMNAIIPRKLPNILNWLNLYKNKNLESKDYTNAFEVPLIETIEKIDEKTDYTDTEKKQLINILYKLYWSQDVQTFSNFKNKLVKLMYKEITLSDNDNQSQEILKILANSIRSPFLVSTKLSSTSKKTAQVYSWLDYQEESALGLNNKIDAVGLYIPTYDKVNTILLQANEGEILPRDISIEIWSSTDNVNYTLSQTISSKITTQLGTRTVALFENTKFKTPYTKIYFTSNQKTIKLNSPINLALQIFETIKK